MKVLSYPPVEAVSFLYELNAYYKPTRFLDWFSYVVDCVVFLLLLVFDWGAVPGDNEDDTPDELHVNNYIHINDWAGKLHGFFTTRLTRFAVFMAFSVSVGSWITKPSFFVESSEYNTWFSWN